VADYISICDRVQKECAERSYDDLKMRCQSYKTSVENWWCRCPSYQDSPYHICKHLVGLYIGEDGVRSNKPRMPFYGQVWRQSTVPVLWIAGIHDESLLVVRDLRPNSAPPILGTTSEATVLHFSAPDNAPEIEPADYYSDEVEDEEDDEDSYCDEDDEGGFSDFGGIGNDNDEYLQDLARREFEGQEKLGKLHTYHDELLLLAQAMDDQASHASVSVMPDPTPQNTSDLMKWAIEYHAKRQERKEKEQKALSYSKRLHHLIQALEHALEYEPTHLHIREIQDPTKAQTSTMMDWTENWYSLENGWVMRATWSPDRRGNMFL